MLKAPVQDQNTCEWEAYMTTIVYVTVSFKLFKLSKTHIDLGVRKHTSWCETELKERHFTPY